MAQEQTAHMMTSDVDLTGGQVRPKSKVKVLFLNSKHHNVPFVIEEVHPAAAEKLVEAGKAEYVKGKGSLTQEQKDANKQHLIDKAKNKGRTAVINDTVTDEDDMLGDKADAGKEPKNKDKGLKVDKL